MAVCYSVLFCVLVSLVYRAHGVVPVITNPSTSPFTHAGIAESSSGGAAILTVTATGGTQSFSLVSQDPDSTPKKFLVATAGAITTNTGATFDREGTSSYTLVVKVTDTAGSATDTAVTTIVVPITDVNDNAPIPNPAKYMLKFEGSMQTYGQGTTIKATDADATAANNVIARYQIDSGNDGDVFAVTAEGGIKVANSKKVDPAVQNAYILLVDVIDSGTPERTGTATFLISVCDSASALTGSLMSAMTLVIAYVLL